MLDLVYRNKAKIESLTLDATLTEEHVGEVDVTSHPVESGVDIQDHLRPKPEQVTIEGIISNTPFGSPTNHPGRDGAYDILRRLKDSGTLVTVQTKLRSYTSMALVRLSVPRNARTTDMLQFTAQFLQVRTVGTRLIQTQIVSKKKQSKHHKVSPPAKSQEAKRTLLKSLSDAAGFTSPRGGP